MALDRSASDVAVVSDAVIRQGAGSAVWQFNVSNETLNGAINIDDLVQEIRASPIVTALRCVGSDAGADKLEVQFKAVLSSTVALSATYTWDGSTIVLCPDTSEVVSGEWIRLDPDNHWFKSIAVIENVSVSIENPASLSIPTGSGQSSKGGDVRRLLGNDSTPRTPGSILGDHAGSSVQNRTPDWDSVLDHDLTTPPVDPIAGDRYIVGISATGDWSGHGNEIAEYNGAGWVFFDPDTGYGCFVQDINRICIWTGIAWDIDSSLVGLGNVPNLVYNLTATSAPTVNDDADDGYSAGSKWVDLTGDKEYTCVDPTSGAAIWIETTGGGGGGSAMHATRMESSETTTTSTTHVNAFSAGVQPPEDGTYFIIFTADSKNASKGSDTIIGIGVNSTSTAQTGTESGVTAGGLDYGGNLTVSHVHTLTTSNTVYGIFRCSSGTAKLYGRRITLIKVTS